MRAETHSNLSPYVHPVGQTRAIINLLITNWLPKFNGNSIDSKLQTDAHYCLPIAFCALTLPPQPVPIPQLTRRKNRRCPHEASDAGALGLQPYIEL